MKIFVCDDRGPEEICGALEQARSAGAEIDQAEKVLTGDNLSEAIEQLFDSADSVITAATERPHGFQGADLILLDYGLTSLKRKAGGPRLTVDFIAGYIRAFSDSGYVLSLNSLRNVDFDLKYLVGDFASRADLAINTDHLVEPGLWTGQSSGKAFCPWYWPRLNTAAQRRRDQIATLHGRLNEPLLQVLGIPKAVIPYLSRQAIAYLSPQADDGDTARQGDFDVRKVTAWHHFRSSNRTLVKNDREELVGAFGGNLKSDTCPDHEHLQRIVARVVAAELEFWFRRDILGPQRLLIDAPHLQVRFPFRTDGHHSDADSWSETAAASDAEPFGLDPNIFALIPVEARYIDSPWLDRPAFWLPLVEDASEIARISDEYDRNTRFVFCEDIRRFVDRDSAERFTTQLAAGLDVRYVARIAGKVYSPLSSFAD